MTKRFFAVGTVDQWVRWALGGLILCLGLSAVYWRAEPVRISDPDRYFHLELARRTAESGHIRGIPEIVDFQKGEFVNFYWLFTWVSSLAHRIDGENGVLALGFCFAAGVLLLLLWLAHERLTIGVSMLLVACVLLSPDTANRLFLFRPHLMSIFLFTVLIAGMIRRNRYVTFTAGLMHALSYQMPLIPALALFAALPFAKKEGRDWLFATYAGFAGLMAGMLLHPYFPQNIFAIAGGIRAAIPAGSTDRGLPISLPMELGGVDWFRLTGGLAPFFLPLVLCAIRLSPRLRRELFKPEFRAPKTEMVWITLCLAAFWCLALLTFRAVEYVLPLSIVAWTLFLSEWKRPAVQARFITLAILFCLPVAWKAYVKDERVRLSPKDILAALSSLPEDPKGRKVLNMDWSHGPHILYSRPGYRMVDMGDPRVLLNQRPDLYEMRHALESGKVADPFGIVKFVFESDFVTTFDGPFRLQMDQSPHFRKYAEVNLSETPGQKFYIYETAPNRLPLQLKRYEYWTGNGRSVAGATPERNDGEWMKWPVNPDIPEAKRTTFVNVTLSDAMPCMKLRPDYRDQSVLLGSTLLTMGGKGEAKVYWNGQRLFSGRLGEGNLRETEWTLPLPRPLSRRDQIVVELCRTGALTGLSMTFTTERTLDALCAWKIPSGSPSPGGWPARAPGSKAEEFRYTSTPHTSCVSQYAY